MTPLANLRSVLPHVRQDSHRHFQVLSLQRIHLPAHPLNQQQTPLYSPSPALPASLQSSLSQSQLEYQRANPLHAQRHNQALSLQMFHPLSQVASPLLNLLCSHLEYLHHSPIHAHHQYQLCNLRLFQVLVLLYSHLHLRPSSLPSTQLIAQLRNHHQDLPRSRLLIRPASLHSSQLDSQALVLRVLQLCSRLRNRQGSQAVGLLDSHLLHHPQPQVLSLLSPHPLNQAVSLLERHLVFQALSQRGSRAVTPLLNHPVSLLHNQPRQYPQRSPQCSHPANPPIFRLHIPAVNQVRSQADSHLVFHRRSLHVCLRRNLRHSPPRCPRGCPVLSLVHNPARNHLSSRRRAHQRPLLHSPPPSLLRYQQCSRRYNLLLFRV